MNRVWFFIVGIVILLISSSQNCTREGNPTIFSLSRESLYSREAGGETYDGKPSSGTYCRFYDNISCQPQVKGLQGLLTVDSQNITLDQDNCATTDTNFRVTDAAVTYSSLFPEYLGLSRGIFRKCEIGSNDLPEVPQEMPDAYCVSSDNKFAAAISKKLMDSNLILSLIFNLGNGVRRVDADNMQKLVSASGVSYSAVDKQIDLSIPFIDAQTSVASLRVSVDDMVLEKKLNCRTSTPLPTVIIEKDLELSSTWINTSALVGYWKLNEPNAGEGTSILDSSPYATHGSLQTGNDGAIKTDTSVKAGAILFDGIDDQVSVPFPGDNHLEIGTGSFTYMLWIKKQGNIGNWDMPFNHGGASNGDAGYDIECGSSNCNACISDGSNVAGALATCASFAPSGTQFLNQWVLLSAVIDRTRQELRAYLNGNLVSTQSTSTVGPIYRNQPIYLGGNTRKFFGSIDDVALWNRPLTDAELLEIYQRLRPKFN